MSDLLTTAEVAALCRVRPETVLAWKRAGRIKPAGRPSKGWLWRREDVEAIVRSGLEVEDRTRTALVVRDQLDAEVARVIQSRRKHA